MQVRVVSAQPTQGCPETDYVRVRTYSDPFDDTVTLATIERVVEKAAGESPREKTVAKRVKTLLVHQPMSPDDALGLATSYAERKKIPVVYADQADADQR